MNEVAKPEFLAMAAQHGLTVDPKYAQNWPRNLSFGQANGQRCYWIPPTDPSELRVFLGCLIEHLGGWTHLYLWPKCVPLDKVLQSDEIEVPASVANAMPLSAKGAIALGRGDVGQLVDLLTAIIQQGWSWPTDVYLIPDSFDTCVMVDHHDAIHVEWATSERSAAFIAAMTMSGYPLPAKPPDGTFKRRPDGTPVN